MSLATKIIFSFFIGRLSAFNNCLLITRLKLTELSCGESDENNYRVTFKLQHDEQLINQDTLATVDHYSRLQEKEFLHPRRRNEETFSNCFDFVKLSLKKSPERHSS